MPDQEQQARGVGLSGGLIDLITNYYKNILINFLLISIYE